MSKERPPLVLIGGGGHATVIEDIVTCGRAHELLGYIDDAQGRPSAMLSPRLGREADLPDLRHSHPGLHLIVAIGDNSVRRTVVKRLNQLTGWGRAVHPSATLAESVEIGAGSVVMAGCTVNVNVRIGRHAIINTGAIVDHAGYVGDFASVGPGASLGGDVTVGSGSHIGIGATVSHGITIGENCVIGAGAVVVRDCTANGVYTGVPARRLRDRQVGDRIF